MVVACGSTSISTRLHHRQRTERLAAVVSQAIGEVLAFGVGVALDPVAIFAVLMLVAGGKRVIGSVFVAVWLLSLGGVGTLVLLIADDVDASRDGAPADWVVAVQIVLGVLLVLIAVWQWRGRPRDDAEPQPPAWMQKVETLTVPKAAGMAVLLAAVKPKNLLLTVGAAVAIAEIGVSTGAEVGALAVFVLLGTLGPGIPLAVSLLVRERAVVILGGVRDWMVRENATIIAILCLIFAAKLLGNALSASPS
jgi:hypothetical protein